MHSSSDQHLDVYLFNDSEIHFAVVSDIELIWFWKYHISLLLYGFLNGTSSFSFKILTILHCSETLVNVDSLNCIEMPVCGTSASQDIVYFGLSVMTSTLQYWVLLSHSHRTWKDQNVTSWNWTLNVYFINRIYVEVYVTVQNLMFILPFFFSLHAHQFWVQLRKTI